MTTADIIIHNDIQELEKIQQFVEKWGMEWDLTSKDIFSLNLVLEELITNIIFYGFEDDLDHEIHIHMNLENEVIELQIEDDGKPFDPFSVSTPGDLDKSLEERRIGGLGIYFVREIMDSYFYKRTDNINHLILSKNVKQ
ncbi:MAG: ATP-binding protein [Bacteroidales bacterium]|nr:ATP-binding protein [Lentimicrobiaceae bacterium]MDD5696085.1 ATP-binding protein [Bacteroidales bacterium]